MKIWNVTTGAACGPLNSDNGQLFGVAFSPDSELLASACEDGSILLWSCATGDLLTVFHIGTPLRVMSISAGGFFLQTTRGPITIRPFTDTNQMSGYGILDNWLTYNHRRLIWLPHKYRNSNGSAIPLHWHY